MNPIIHRAVDALIFDYYKAVSRFVKSDFSQESFKDLVSARADLVSAKVDVNRRSDLDESLVKEFSHEIDKKVSVVNTYSGIFEKLKLDHYFYSDMVRYLIDYVDMDGNTVASVPMDDVYHTFIPDKIVTVVNELVTECNNYRKANQVLNFSRMDDVDILLYSPFSNSDEYEELNDLIYDLYSLVREDVDRIAGIDTFSVKNTFEKIMAIQGSIDDSKLRDSIDYLVFSVMIEGAVWIAGPDNLVMTSKHTEVS